METILVVDDDDLVREILAIRFGSLGYRCLEAENGEAALALLATTPVDCILLDSMMPMLSGAEMVMRLRANPDWSGIPVLMLTHCASLEERRRALALGAGAFLAKPFAMDEVVALVRKLIDGRTNRAVRRLKVTVMGSVALSAALPGAAMAGTTEPVPNAPSVSVTAPAPNPARPADTPPRTDIPAPDPAAQLPSAQAAAPVSQDEAKPVYTVALVQGFTDTTRGAPGGRETSASFTYADGRRTGYTVQVDHARRFGATDTTALVQIDRRLTRRTSGYLALTATPDAAFRERWGVRAGISGAVATGLEIGTDTRLAQYRDGLKLAATPSVTLSAWREQAALNLGYISLWSLSGEDRGNRRDGFTARLTLRPENKPSFLAGLARYPEVETGIARQVTSRYAGIAYPVSGRLRLSAGFASDRYESQFTRNTVTIGLSMRLNKPG